MALFNVINKNFLLICYTLRTILYKYLIYKKLECTVNYNFIDKKTDNQFVKNLMRII